MPSAFSTLAGRPLIDYENTSDSSSNLLPRVPDRTTIFGK